MLFCVILICFWILDIPTRNPNDYDRVEDSSSPNLFDFINNSDSNDSIGYYKNLIFLIALIIFLTIFIS